MPTAKKRLYAEITKSEKQDDGTIIVEGFASSGAVDCDGETITPDAMKSAIPDYMKFANVREMHDPKKAAGTALEAEVQEDGRTRFVAHVVDPVAVLKVETGVYKGFSIGAKIPKGGRDAANKSVINAIELYEVSLVDRPANPDAVFTCFKAEGAGPDEDPENPDDGDGFASDVRKGLYNLESMIRAMSYLRDCCATISYEVEQGQHSKKMADGMRELLLGMGAFCQKYLGEELANFAAEATKAFGGETSADMVAKAVAAEKEEAAKAAGELQTKVEELQKAIDSRAQQDEQAIAEVSEIAKAAGLVVEEKAGYQDLLKAALVEMTSAKVQLAQALTKAASPKGHRMTVSKSADMVGGDEPQVKPVASGDGGQNEVATLIKAAQARPIQVI